MEKSGPPKYPNLALKIDHEAELVSNSPTPFVFPGNKKKSGILRWFTRIKLKVNPEKKFFKSPVWFKAIK